MNSTKVEQIVQKVIQQIFKDLSIVPEVIQDLQRFSLHTRLLIVGGTVRDALLDLPIKDLDIEIYGIALDELEKILKKYGIVRKVGKVFGVLRIDGFSIDWSIPRTDGPGRKPITVFYPELSYKEAFARRDLTINAMGIDCMSG